MSGSRGRERRAGDAGREDIAVFHLFQRTRDSAKCYRIARARCLLYSGWLFHLGSSNSPSTILFRRGPWLTVGGTYSGSPGGAGLATT